MKYVWKYELEVKDEQTVSIPHIHKILHVATQNNKPCMWVMVEKAVSKKDYTIITKGTGHNCLSVNEKEYIGTYLIRNDSFVGHVFIKEDK